MNPNTVYDGGNHALHIAASTGILALVTWLVDKGANIWVLNHNDQSPMDVAYAHGRKNVVRFLQKKAAYDMHSMHNEFHSLNLSSVNHLQSLHNTTDLFS